MGILEMFKKHDWVLNGAFAILSAAGLFVMASIAAVSPRPLFWSQALWIALSAVFIAALSYLDWRTLINYRWMMLVIYFGSIALLIATLLVGTTIRGAKSWIEVGPLRFQTAELAKVAFLVILSYFFARRHFAIRRPSNILRSFIYCALPAGLILLQPDWGSALIFFSIWLGFLLVSGIRWSHVFIGLIAVLLVGMSLWGFAFKPYHKERIIGFLQPEYDPQGINYSAIQSKIAIGSAGWFGKGFRQGTQTQLRFLTEPATDFVLAAWIEEWGLVGGLAVLGAFGLLIFRIIRIGLRSGHSFSMMICLGTVILFLVQFALNVGSTLGLLPVVGVTFPFLSYGGSSFLTSALLVGIIQSIAVRS